MKNSSSSFVSVARSLVLASFTLATWTLASASLTETAHAATLDPEEAGFLHLLNDYRARSGLAPIHESSRLKLAADWMSRDMASGGYLDHTDAEGRSPFQRMSAYGYSMAHTAGENIACGNASAAATFQQWRQSPAHNANMLSPDYKEIGIARAASSGASVKGRSGCGWYWTTDFGG